jgi:hypothetical protein
MKALFFPGALLIAALGGQAQGTFAFNNRIQDHLIAEVYDTDRVTGLAGANHVAAIFLNGVQLGASAPFRTGSAAGYWNPGADSTRTVIGKFSGDIVNGFIVKAWDSSRGATWEAVRSAGGKYGESKPFSITLGGPKSDPDLPPDLPGQMHKYLGFSLVPEPSVAALGGVGALLFLTRHRKRRCAKLEGRSTPSLPE